jgi:hypothetical protein
MRVEDLSTQLQSIIAVGGWRSIQCFNDTDQPVLAA